ncbi:uncharacterized protein LOC144431215 [Styela clava]
MQQKQIEALVPTLGSQANSLRTKTPTLKGRISAKSPPELTADISLSGLDSWKIMWSDYMQISGYNQEPQKKQVAVFRGCLSLEMLSVVKHVLNISEETEKSVDDILEDIKKHIRIQRNVALDRVLFEERKQGDEESFDSFLIALKKLGKDADLCENCYDERLTTRIIAGARNATAREELLAKSPFPNLQTAVDLCRSKEMAIINNSDLSKKQNPIANSIQIKKPFQRRFKPKNDRNNMPCQYCGRRHSQGKLNCPAYGKICGECGKKNHFSQKCRTKVNTGETIGVVKVRAIQENRRAPKISINVFSPTGNHFWGTSLALPDSGAEICLGSRKFLEQINCDVSNLKSHTQDIFAANGTKIDSLGYMDVRIEYQGNKSRERIYISDNIDGAVLAWYTCTRLKILPETYPAPICNGIRLSRKKQIQLPPQTEENVEAIRSILLTKYEDVFDAKEKLDVMDGSNGRISTILLKSSKTNTLRSKR